MHFPKALTTYSGNKSQNVSYTRYSEADSLYSESSLGVVVELREFISERNYDAIRFT
jgi:hypothetical protein